MENKLIAVLLAIIMLGIGFSVGYNSNVVTKTEIETETIYVDKIVNTTVEKVTLISYLDIAVQDFMNAVDEEDEVDVLGNYNFDEVSIKKIYDSYTMSVDDDVTVVEFSIKLKFDDENEREINTYDVRVTYEEDEDVEVELI